jgi:tRNA modification GTPase
VDTAGIRDSDDPVEQEGVRRASEQAADADLVLWVVDASVAGTSRPWEDAGLPAGGSSDAPIWFLVNKIDLIDLNQWPRIEPGFKKELTVHLLSAETGRGVDQLVQALARFAEGVFPPEPALVTRERQRAHLRECIHALCEARHAAGEGREEIFAEHLRLAARALGKLLGRVDVEDVLDSIFRDFCIGK